MHHTRSLLESEREMIGRCITAHEEKEALLKDDSSKRAADWQNRKVALEEELLRVNLQMNTANTEASTFKRVTSKLN